MICVRRCFSAAIQLALTGQALGKQESCPGGEPGHDIRTVREEGDVAEALRLTLRAEVSPGLVQTLQRSVLLRLDANHGAKQEGRGRRAVHCEKRYRAPEHLQSMKAVCLS